tara:strand:+ start:14056 stop:14283 length:228 start_codon:yes stop_codon:yes gene_type:complete
MSEFNDNQHLSAMDSLAESYQKRIAEYHAQQIKLINAIYEIKKHTQLIEHQLEMLLVGMGLPQIDKEETNDNKKA